MLPSAATSEPSSETGSWSSADGRVEVRTNAPSNTRFLLRNAVRPVQMSPGFIHVTAWLFSACGPWVCVEMESSRAHPEHDPKIQESPKPVSVSRRALMGLPSCCDGEIPRKSKREPPFC